jgi:hypothetical protein
MMVSHFRHLEEHEGEVFGPGLSSVAHANGWLLC